MFIYILIREWIKESIENRRNNRIRNISINIRLLEKKILEVEKIF
jgi:hypothetical protein